VRRTISIVVAVVLAIGVVATIVVSADRSEKRATVVRGVVDAESRAFFDDARVKNALERHHYDVKFDTVDDRAMTSTLDLSRYDFAFTSGTPVAEKISAERGVAQSYVPFVSPMAFATFGDIATILENAGVARRHGAYWTLDVKAYLDLVKRSTRWNDLRANTTYPAAKFVLVRTAA
jgi:hypothetical protein